MLRCEIKMCVVALQRAVEIHCIGASAQCGWLSAGVVCSQLDARVGEREVTVDLLAYLGGESEKRKPGVVLETRRLSARSKGGEGGRTDGRRSDLQWKVGGAKQAAFQHDAVVQMGPLNWWEHFTSCAIFYSG